MKRLEAGNDYIRSTALRLLQERLRSPIKGLPIRENILPEIVLNENNSTQLRLQALWALMGAES